MTEKELLFIKKMVKEKLVLLEKTLVQFDEYWAKQLSDLYGEEVLPEDVDDLIKDLGDDIKTMHSVIYNSLLFEIKFIKDELKINK